MRIVSAFTFACLLPIFYTPFFENPLHFFAREMFRMYQVRKNCHFLYYTTNSVSFQDTQFVGFRTFFLQVTGGVGISSFTATSARRLITGGGWGITEAFRACLNFARWG